MPFDAAISVPSSPYVERLERLCTLLERVHPENFSLRYWYDPRSGNGCAIGHAMRDAWFQNQGLRETSFVGSPCYKNTYDFEAVSKFFGITLEESGRLFDGREYSENELCDPHAVIKRIRHFLRQHGRHSVSDELRLCLTREVIR